MSDKELAAEQGVSIATVRTRRWRAKRGGEQRLGDRYAPDIEVSQSSCPSCGGPKSARSMNCQDCRNRLWSGPDPSTLMQARDVSPGPAIMMASQKVSEAVANYLRVGGDAAGLEGAILTAKRSVGSFMVLPESGYADVPTVGSSAVAHRLDAA